MGHDLGVGLGGEVGAGGHQAVAQLDVVLDDAVQDDVDVARRVVVGMGVLLGHAAVGGPARVADARCVASGASVATPPGSPSASTASRRWARLPTARTDSISPSASRDRPAESYPRYSSFSRPASRSSAARTAAYVSDDSAHLRPANASTATHRFWRVPSHVPDPPGGTEMNLKGHYLVTAAAVLSALVTPVVVSAANSDDGPLGARRRARRRTIRSRSRCATGAPARPAS